MTVKLVVLYTRPSDADEFERHYLDVHGPLVRQIPGLQRFEGARLLTAADGGDQVYFRIAELYFADQEAMQAGLNSDQGRATAEDFRAIAPPSSRMYVAEIDE
jgi:uncharacterized protein (TIGR02118 family)